MKKASLTSSSSSSSRGRKRTSISKPKKSSTSSTKSTSKQQETLQHTEDDDDENPTACMYCHSPVDDELTILCDGPNCQHEAHLYCLNPPLLIVPEGEWLCEFCDPKGSTSLLEKYLHSHQEVFDSFQINNREAYDEYLHVLRYMTTSIEDIQFDKPEHYYESEFNSTSLQLIGAQIILLNTFDDRWHHGRIIDVKSLEVPYKRTMHLIQFKSGADGRNQPLIAWICLNEHILLVGKDVVWLRLEKFGWWPGQEFTRSSLALYHGYPELSNVIPEKTTPASHLIYVYYVDYFTLSISKNISSEVIHPLYDRVLIRHYKNKSLVVAYLLAYVEKNEIECVENAYRLLSKEYLQTSGALVDGLKTSTYKTILEILQVNPNLDSDDMKSIHRCIDRLMTKDIITYENTLQKQNEEAFSTQKMTKVTNERNSLDPYNLAFKTEHDLDLIYLYSEVIGPVLPEKLQEKWISVKFKEEDDEEEEENDEENREKKEVKSQKIKVEATEEAKEEDDKEAVKEAEEGDKEAVKEAMEVIQESEQNENEDIKDKEATTNEENKSNKDINPPDITQTPPKSNKETKKPLKETSHWIMTPFSLTDWIEKEADEIIAKQEKEQEEIQREINYQRHLKRQESLQKKKQQSELVRKKKEEDKERKLLQKQQRQEQEQQEEEQDHEGSQEHPILQDNKKQFIGLSPRKTRAMIANMTSVIPAKYPILNKDALLITEFHNSTWIGMIIQDTISCHIGKIVDFDSRYVYISTTHEMLSVRLTHCAIVPYDAPEGQEFIKELADITEKKNSIESVENSPIVKKETDAEGLTNSPKDASAAHSGVNEQKDPLHEDDIQIEFVDRTKTLIQTQETVLSCHPSQPSLPSQSSQASNPSSHTSPEKKQPTSLNSQQLFEDLLDSDELLFDSDDENLDGHTLTDKSTSTIKSSEYNSLLQLISDASYEDQQDLLHCFQDFQNDPTFDDKTLLLEFLSDPNKEAPHLDRFKSSQYYEILHEKLKKLKNPPKITVVDHHILVQNPLKPSKDSNNTPNNNVNSMNKSKSKKKTTNNMSSKLSYAEIQEIYRQAMMEKNISSATAASTSASFPPKPTLLHNNNPSVHQQPSRITPMMHQPPQAIPLQSSSTSFAAQQPPQQPSPTIQYIKDLRAVKNSRVNVTKPLRSTLSFPLSNKDSNSQANKHTHTTGTTNKMPILTQIMQPRTQPTPLSASQSSSQPSSQEPHGETITPIHSTKPSIQPTQSTKALINPLPSISSSSSGDESILGKHTRTWVESIQPRDPRLRKKNEQPSSQPTQPTHNSSLMNPKSFPIKSSVTINLTESSGDEKISSIIDLSKAETNQEILFFQTSPPANNNNNNNTNNNKVFPPSKFKQLFEKTSSIPALATTQLPQSRRSNPFHQLSKAEKEKPIDLISSTQVTNLLEIKNKSLLPTTTISTILTNPMIVSDNKSITSTTSSSDLGFIPLPSETLIDDRPESDRIYITNAFNKSPSKEPPVTSTSKHHNKHHHNDLLTSDSYPSKETGKRKHLSEFNALRPNSFLAPSKQRLPLRAYQSVDHKATSSAKPPPTNTAYSTSAVVNPSSSGNKSKIPSSSTQTQPSKKSHTTTNTTTNTNTTAKTISEPLTNFFPHEFLLEDVDTQITNPIINPDLLQPHQSDNNTNNTQLSKNQRRKLKKQMKIAESKLSLQEIDEEIDEFAHQLKAIEHSSQDEDNEPFVPDPKLFPIKGKQKSVKSRPKPTNEADVEEGEIFDED